MEASAPSYSDAEKGLVDIHEQRPVGAAPVFSGQAPSYPTDEKKALVSANFFPPPKEKEKPAAAAQPPARPPAKKKKKVSKWILFKLWFNTYRSVDTFVQLFPLTDVF